MLILNPTSYKSEFSLYSDEGYSFAYPVGALFARFPGSADGEHKLRLVYEDVRINIEFPALGTSARQAAEQLYGQEMLGQLAPDDPLSSLIAKPQPLSPGRDEAWRCRLVWRDPAYAPLMIDTVFFQSPRGLFRIRFSSPHDDYENNIWVFEALLNTFCFTA
jgi:hypothetical protein